MEGYGEKKNVYVISYFDYAVVSQIDLTHRIISYSFSTLIYINNDPITLVLHIHSFSFTHSLIN